MNTNDPTQIQSNTDIKPQYENNPLYIATNGLDLLFKKALSIGILMAILSALSIISGLSNIPSSLDPQPTGQPAPAASKSTSEAEATNFMNAIANVPLEMWLFIALIVVVVLAVVILIGTVFQGISDVTSAHLARGGQIGLTDALKEVFSNFWGYLWVLIVMNVKIILWTLLFVIPGIIMAVRYSLSGVVYFDKKLKGNAAVQESSRLVKGGWLTTFSSEFLLNILTLGYIAPVLMPGTNAVLYRQFSANPENKPKAHIISWLTLIIPLVLGTLLLVLLLGLGATT